MPVLGSIFLIVALVSFAVIIFSPSRIERISAGLLTFFSLLAVGYVIGADSEFLDAIKVKFEKSTITEIFVRAGVESLEEQSALAINTISKEPIPSPCGQGGVVLNDVFAVSGEHQIRQGPDQSSPRIKNEKASRALGRAHYHVIDNSTTVRRVCVQAEWTKIRIVSPDWLIHVTGWVQNAALREIERTSDGSRTFVEADFYWDSDTRQFKDQIIMVVNRISRENRNCSMIDPSSVAKSPSRSQPNDPVFFVTCGSGTDVFNVWFRPDEAESKQHFNARTPLKRNTAVDACEAAARAAATHPSTVEFSRIWDLAYIPHVAGRARVVSSFTARNGFNLELKYRIDCLFDGANLIETNIIEERS